MAARLPAEKPDTVTEHPPQIHWTENGEAHSARWRAEGGTPAPKRVQVVDDQTPADLAYRLACEGQAMLWRGDFHNARQLLPAMETGKASRRERV